MSSYAHVIWSITMNKGIQGRPIDVKKTRVSTMQVEQVAQVCPQIALRHVTMEVRLLHMHSGEAGIPNGVRQKSMAFDTCSIK